MEKAINLAVKGGYMVPKAVRFAGANNGRMTKDGPGTLNGWSVWELPSGSSFTIGHYEIVLDPLFWQALGKAEWWNGTMIFDHVCFSCGKDGGANSVGGCNECGAHYRFDHKWLYHWHRFIDHLASGDTPDTFFEELFRKEK